MKHIRLSLLALAPALLLGFSGCADDDHGPVTTSTTTTEETTAAYPVHSSPSRTTVTEVRQ